MKAIMRGVRKALDAYQDVLVRLFPGCWEIIYVAAVVLVPLAAGYGLGALVEAL
jgi:hypothetical protein